jgi:hypothetical protein
MGRRVHSGAFGLSVLPRGSHGAREHHDSQACQKDHGSSGLRGRMCALSSPFSSAEPGSATVIRFCNGPPRLWPHRRSPCASSAWISCRNSSSRDPHAVPQPAPGAIARMAAGCAASRFLMLGWVDGAERLTCGRGLIPLTRRGFCSGSQSGRYLAGPAMCKQDVYRLWRGFMG